MKLGELFIDYFVWHYGKAFLDITQIFRNILWFLFNFFSIPILIRTLFSPLKRLHETYHGDFDIAEFISTIAVNILMRIIGAVLRLFVIVLGAVMLFIASLVWVASYAVWVVLPALVPVLFFAGLIVAVS